MGKRSTSSETSCSLAEICTQWLRNCTDSEDATKRKEDFRSEAKRFFASRAPDEVEGDLANLVKQLGPVFMGKSQSRISAMNYLRGAIEGCDGSYLTKGMINHLGTFLVGQCLPIPSEVDRIEDYIEEVRDAAVLSLSSLVNYSWENDEHKPEEVVDSVKIRLEFARRGLENRCVPMIEDDDMEFDQGYDSTPQDRLVGNLSNLPRLRRSICFTLLKSSVNGVAKGKCHPTHEIASCLEETLVSFTVFSIDCLQGESDPRCIMQLMVHFYSIQKTFEPFFLLQGSSGFPITQLFDGIAPYYPIQFTPPPDDINGITKDGLRGALMAVLCSFDLDELAAKDEKDTMQSLTLGIVLERLIPIDGDDSGLAQTASEKLNALEDLAMVLLPNHDHVRKSNNLNALMMKQVSAALISLHEEASMAASTGGEESKIFKTLADTCRIVISKVAYLVEGVPDASIWNAFVMEPLKSLSLQLASQTHGQTAIAYMACLASSGGPQTLRYSLELGLNSLIKLLEVEEDNMVTMSAYGISAFFSSCRVAIDDKMAKDGIVLSPHPLRPFSNIVFNALYVIFQSKTTALITKIAAVRALETVIMITPMDQFSDDDELKICKFIVSLTDYLLQTTQFDDDNNAMNEPEWRKACAQTLGSLLGTALGKIEFSEKKTDEVSDDEVDEKIVQSKMVMNLVKDDIFVKLVASVKLATVKFDSARFDRIALALACNVSLPGAKFIIETLLQALNNCIDQSILSPTTEGCVAAVSFILHHGGYTAAKALHELTSPKITLRDIYEKLSHVAAPDEVQRISTLRLPLTKDEREVANGMLDKVYGIVSSLLPVYHRFVPNREIAQLISDVEKVVPPMSENDYVKLFITLPVLSASLKHCRLHNIGREDNITHKSMVDKLIFIGTDILALALNADYDPRVRSAAASCLYCSVAQSVPDGTRNCPAYHLMKFGIEPLIVSTIGSASTPEGFTKKDLNLFIDCLNIGALLGSAAVSRGGTSLATADAIASFFVELACRRISSIPFSDSGDRVDLLKCYSYENTIVVSAISAFGSMVAVADRNPLFKQRLTHKTLKFLQPTIDPKIKLDYDAQPLGPLGIICHIISSSSVKNSSKAIQNNIARFMEIGLSPDIFYTINPSDASLGPNLGSLKRLFLASLLKLLCDNSFLFSNNIDFVATGLLRAYAATANSNPTTEIVCKLLALQALERLPHLNNAKQSLMPITPAVVSILGAAMNHPSRLLRLAAVQVKNSWCIVI